MAFSGSQKTALSPMGIGGPIKTFVAKTEVVIIAFKTLTLQARSFNLDLKARNFSLTLRKR